MLSYLVGSVTQGSADAFAQASITTGLQNVARQAFRVRRLEFSFPLVVGADCNIQLALARKSWGSFPTIDEPSVISAQTRQVEMTTSGMVVTELVERQTFEKDEDLLIVEDPLYLVIDSAGTSAANIGYIRIGYEPRTITEVERLALIAASLA